MSLTLKVVYPPGIGFKSKPIKFKATLTVKEAIEEILKGHKVSIPLEEFVLLLSPPDPEAQRTIWFEEAKLLRSYPLQDKDTIQIRRKFQVVKVQYRRGVQRLLINVSEPLNALLATCAKKFQLEGKLENYSLRLRKNEIDAKKNVRDQGLSTDVIYILKNNQEQFIEIEDDFVVEKEESDEPVPPSSPGKSLQSSSSYPGSKMEQNPSAEEVEDLQNIGPKQVKNPQKQGFLGLKVSRKKKFEPKYLVVKNNMLAAYKTQNDKKPAALFDLSGHVVKTVEPADEKEKKSKDFAKEYQYTFAAIKADQEIIFKCENDNQVNSWKSVIEVACTAGPKGGQTGPVKVFGVDLSELPPGRDIPEIVESCIKYLEERGLKQVGIFRLSGSAVAIEAYKQAFDKGVKVDLTKENDVNAVAGLLKLYFRQLPEPILTYKLYNTFIATQSAPIAHLRITYLAKAVADLPAVNRNVLKYLVTFLIRVNEFSSVNQMGIPQLATVFGPNLLKPPEDNIVQMVQDTPIINAIVNDLIQSYDAVFLNKLPQTLNGVALHDYTALSKTEISFKAGTPVKVYARGEDGWWQGEANGVIGIFPGSYIKLEAKTPFQIFKENMDQTKRKLEEEQANINALTASKAELLKEVEAMKEEAKKYHEETKVLQQRILKILKEEKLPDFIPCLEKMKTKLSQYQTTAAELDKTRQAFVTESEVFKTTLNNPPADLKKSLKGKISEKFEPQIGLLITKQNHEAKKRKPVQELFSTIEGDITSLHALLTKQ